MNFAPKIFASILYFSSWGNHSEVNRKNFSFSTKQQRPSFLYEDRIVWGTKSCMEEVEEEDNK